MRRTRPRREEILLQIPLQMQQNVRLRTVRSGTKMSAAPASGSRASRPRSLIRGLAADNRVLPESSLIFQVTLNHGLYLGTRIYAARRSQRQRQKCGIRDRITHWVERAEQATRPRQSGALP